MKRLRSIAPTLLLLALAVLAGAAGQDATYNLVGWRTLEMTESRIVASGGAPRITSGDGKLRLSASRLVLALTKSKGRQMIATVQAVGRVKLRVVRGAGAALDATCERAVIRPSQQRAELSGNVIVKRFDSARFARPVVLSGDTVTLYLKEGRVVATSRPSGSRFSVSPKSSGRP
ncbi:MAG: hypothetical protein Q7T82_10675 [Armatimonadota bacterium]|nr:hypothetical protein [Armatimonadota bacterium]